MSRIYEGKHPCSGCGISGKEKRRMSKDDLCSDCKDLLKLGKIKKEEVKNRGPQMPLVAVSIPWHNLMGRVQLSIGNVMKGDNKHVITERLPYISDADSEFINSKTLLKPYREFIESISVPDNTRDRIGRLWVGDDSKDVIGEIPVNVARAFTLFMKELINVFHIEYEQGRLEAMNFITELNSGSVSIDKFDETNERISKKIQELKQP